MLLTYPVTGESIELFALSQLLAQNALSRGIRKLISGSYHMAWQWCRLVRYDHHFYDCFILMKLRLSKVHGFSSNDTSTPLLIYLLLIHWPFFFFLTLLLPVLFRQATVYAIRSWCLQLYSKKTKFDRRSIYESELLQQLVREVASWECEI